MKECPCIKCENKGCGVYHDKCGPYQEYVSDRKAGKAEICKRKDFTRKVRMPHKGSRTWGKHNNLGY